MTRITADDGFAVVTGAGSGLGRALARELCATGLRTVGLGRRAEALAETAARCGDRFRAEVCDVAEPAEVAACFARLRTEEGALALLVNNAAVYPHRDFLDETPERFMATVAVNLGGVVSCSHAALQDMTERGTGRILNVATFADVAPLPTTSAYAVSKGAARILTRALMADLGDRFPGIVISDWMPGMLDTEMGIAGGLAPETAARWGARLALMCDPALSGTTFEMDREVLPPRSLKGRVKELLLMQRRVPRRL